MSSRQGLLGRLLADHQAAFSAACAQSPAAGAARRRRRRAPLRLRSHQPPPAALCPTHSMPDPSTTQHIHQYIFEQPACTLSSFYDDKRSQPPVYALLIMSAISQ